MWAIALPWDSAASPDHGQDPVNFTRVYSGLGSVCHDHICLRGHAHILRGFVLTLRDETLKRSFKMTTKSEETPEERLHFSSTPIGKNEGRAALRDPMGPQNMNSVQPSHLQRQ